MVHTVEWADLRDEAPHERLYPRDQGSVTSERASQVNALGARVQSCICWSSETRAAGVALEQLPTEIGPFETVSADNSAAACGWLANGRQVPLSRSHIRSLPDVGRCRAARTCCL